MRQNEVSMEIVIAFIDANFRATLSVKEIAARFKIDPADLDRAFRRVKNRTIKRFIDDKCKEKLETCLRGCDCRGYEIGHALGFNNDQAFYRWAKRVYGIPYRELKRRICRERWESPGGQSPQSNKG